MTSSNRSRVLIAEHYCTAAPSERKITFLPLDRAFPFDDTEIVITAESNGESVPLRFPQEMKAIFAKCATKMHHLRAGASNNRAKIRARERTINQID